MVTGYITLTGKLQEVLLKVPTEVGNHTADIELPGAYYLLEELFKTGKPITARFTIENVIDATANGCITRVCDSSSEYSISFYSMAGPTIFFLSIIARIENPDIITISLKAVE